MRPLVRLPLALALSVSLSAQGKVWVVDDDAGPDVDFTVISEAVEAAADGDVLLVRAGEYDALTPYLTSALLEIIGKSLVVTADRGAHVVLRPSFGMLPVLHVHGLGPDQSVVLRGLDLVGPSGATALAAVEGVEGSVRFEDCRLRGEQGALNQWTLLVKDCADLTLVRSSVAGRGHAISAVQLVNTHAHFFETEIRGGDGADSFAPFTNGGGAVSLDGGSLVAAGGSFRGGDGGSPAGSFPCTLVSGGDGGPGLVVPSGQVLLSSVALTGGAPGNGANPSCPDGAPGAALVDPTGAVTAAPEPARGVRSASPVRAGRDAVLALTGHPGEEAFAVVASAPGALLAPALGGALLVGDPTAILQGGPVQAWGSTTLLVQAPPLPTGIEAATWHVQAVFLDPTLGVRLGGVTALTVLGP